MIIDATGTYCAENILYLRKKYCVSRRALANLLDMSEQILKAIETKSQPPIFFHQRLDRLQDIFAIPLEEILHKDLSSQQNNP